MHDIARTDAPPRTAAEMIDFAVDWAKRQNRKAERTKARLVSLFDALAAHGWKPGEVAGWGPQEAGRWYTKLIDARITQKNLPLAAVALETAAANRPDTVRGIMYQIVSAGWLPDTGKKSYARTQRLLNNLRKKRVLPFPWIVDNIRSTIRPSSWTGLGDFADTVAGAYRKDFWAQLPECVEVIVEKDTVAGKLAPVTREYDVALHPLRGYSSTSFAWEIGQQWRRIKKPIAAYYVGDHDPSGRDLERSIREGLSGYSGREFEWRRLAVNPDQFELFDILALKPKQNDSRYQRFVDQHGQRCAEVEAVPAPELRRMVREAIETHIPRGEWERLKRVESLERERWHEVMDQLDGGELDTPRLNGPEVF